MRERAGKSRLLIVDDHPLVRAGLERLIRFEPGLEVCGAADSSGDAIRLVHQLNPDLVLVDLVLKNGSGLDLCKQLATIRPGLRLLVLSAQDENLYAERALRAGAHGFVSKEADWSDLVNAIRAVLADKAWVASPVAERVVTRVIRRENLAQSPIELLTDRELDVFELLGHGLTSHQIAARLYLSPKTVESHRERLKVKLNLRNSTELVHRALLWALEQRSGREPVKPSPTLDVP